MGDDQWVLKSTYPLIIDQLELEKGQKLVITYLMRVTAGAGRGSLKNTAWADDVRKYVSSNKATAVVNRGLDPDFEATRIFGKVFGWCDTTEEQARFTLHSHILLFIALFDALITLLWSNCEKVREEAQMELFLGLIFKKK